MKAFFYIIIVFPLVLSAQWITLPFSSGLPNQAINFINKDTGFVSCGVFQGPPSINIHSQLYKTKDGGNNWQMIYNDLSNTPISQMTFFNDTFGLYRRWQDVVMKTYTSGATGYSILSGGQVSAGSKFQTFDSTKYLFPTKDEIRYTLNGGMSWVSRSLSTYIPNTLGGNVSQFANLKNGFVFLINSYTLSPSYTEIKFCKTTDSCQTLQAIYSKTITGFFSDPIDIKFINDSTAIMANNNLVLKVKGYTNTTFDTLFKFTSPEVIHQVSVKDNMIIVSGNYGTLLTSLDSGSTFQISGVSPTPLEFSIADAKLGIVYALTSANTVIKLSGLNTSLKTHEEPAAHIYPNPANDYIYLSYDNNLTKEIDIFNLTGSLVKSFTLHPNATHIDKLWINELNRGYYILKIKSANKIEYIKFIKE